MSKKLHVHVFFVKINARQGDPIPLTIANIFVVVGQVC
ncbi:hypothetical protein FTV88_0278 [Heliorestis convoluta]|uniref:Uncharacterized protein n=1 Tax=Heliorestis convoluta TaxID=356322 RepID=A0A5Q2MW29_9FIRM|nr:hypothetical protein FTV88_0278 [Heliorestis convoluta]